MKRAVWLLALAAFAQEPAELLERVRDKRLFDPSHLPKSCVATIDRNYFSRRVTPVAPPRCEQIAMDRKKGRYNLQLNATDRVRVMVRFATDAEVYSWTGTAPYSHGVEDVLHTGPIGTGAFGAHLVDLFENPAVKFRLLREQPAAVEYGFRVPIEVSHFSVGTRTGWLPAGYSGSLTVDRQSFEVRRFAFETDELPPQSLACQVDTSIEFPDHQPAGSKWFLPSESRTRTVAIDTTETERVTTLSACSDSPPPPPAPDPEVPPLRPGLTIWLDIHTPIDTNVAAAGDAISATVAKPVFTGAGTTIPPGARVSGRIVEMLHRRDTGYFFIAIAFDTLDANGVRSPFYARLTGPLTVEKMRGAEQSMVLTGHGMKKWPYGLFGFGPSREQFVVQAPFHSVWVTTAREEAK